MASKMPTNKLRDADCKGAKPAGKAYKRFDGGGLFLYVSPFGLKSWRVAYRLNGSPKTRALGKYPDVSLSEAREKLAALKAILRGGGTPMAGRRAVRGIEMHLFPALGKVPVGAITREALLAALAVMDAAGRHVYVRKGR
jgi:hypothetical protein